MITRIRFTLTFLLGLALTVVPVVAQAASSETEVQKVQEEWRTALTTANAGALEGILSDQLVYVHSDGRIQNRQEFLAPLVAGKMRFEAITSCDTPRVRAYDSSAIISACYELHTANSSTPSRHLFMSTFVKNAGKWQIIAIQTTALPKK